MDVLGQFIGFIILLVLGFVFGRRAERNHYESIIKREDELRSIIVTTDRLPPTEYIHHQSQLVTGSVVIAVDYFKVVTAGLRTLIGGRLKSYESLLDRARREAILRMQAEAAAVGAEAIINTKFETCRISGNAGKGIGSMEVLAYGTALTPPK